MNLKDLNALRILLKRATKPQPQTPEQRQAKKVAYRMQRRAEVLAWAVEKWQADYLRIRTAFPNGIAPEFGIGEKPTTWTARIDSMYRHHINTQQMEKAHALAN